MAISVTGDAELKTDYNKPPTDLDAMGIYSDVLVFGTTDHRTAIVEYLAEVLLVRPFRGEVTMIAAPGAKLFTTMQGGCLGGTGETGRVGSYPPSAAHPPPR